MKKPIFLSVLALLLLIAPSGGEAQSDVMCTMQYQPVCGTQGGTYKTFGNGCMLGAEKAVYQHEGECTASELAGMQVGVYTPPAHCIAWNDGCNSCGRGPDGQATCTLMACMGAPRAGYCTAYAETEAPEPGPPGTINSENTDTQIAVVATDTSPEPSPFGTTTGESDPGFLFGLWRSITSWFQGLFSF